MGNIASTVSSRLRFSIIEAKRDALALLDSAEKKDAYLETCHTDKTNNAARRNLTYYPNPIPERDVHFAKEFLEAVKDDIPIKLQNELGQIHIIQLMGTADGGMPHTRPDSIICFPSISQLFSKTTLIHELWHIHQRNYLAYWRDVFQRIGWSEWRGELPVQLEENQRYNPDTIDSPLWIFQNKWIPIPIFQDITRPRVGEVEIWFYNPHDGYHVKRVPPEIGNYFGDLPLAAFEHPREITAYMLSEPNKYLTVTAFNDLLDTMGRIAVNTKNMSFK